MSEVIAEDLVGASLKAFAKGAGEEGVKEICSSLMGSLIGGGDNSSAEADAKILDQLSQIMSSLTQVQDSLQRIEQAIAQVDLDVVAVGIQKEKSIITSRYDSYFDALNGLAAAAKAKDRISFSQWRDRLVEESIQVKNDIPSNLNVIHGFIVDQNYLGKLANDAINIAVDIVDFYSKVKLPLLKIAMVEIKGIHLLQFAGAASKDTGVNFPDASSAVERVLSHLEEQDQALPKAIGPKTYGLVSTILTAYPKPASACISAYETRGLTYGKRNGESLWYGGENAQMWHIEPANDGPIVTDGSKVNGFRLLHVDSKKYIAIQPKTSTAPFILPYYDLTAVDSSKDAAIWNFHLTSDWKFHIQSQAYPETYLTGVNYKDDSYQPLHYIYLAKDYGSRAKDTQSFIGNTYQGSVNDFWPGNITELHDGEYLLPGSYLEDNNHRNFRFTFQDNKLGVWDVRNKAWKWDSGVAIDTSSDPYLRFSGAGILTLYQNSKQIKTWGPVSPGGTNYILGVTFGGALVIETGDAMYPNWSSE